MFNRKLRSLLNKTLRGIRTRAKWEFAAKVTALGERVPQAELFVPLLYRKFLKSSEIVYNEQELKNGITKERMVIRHDVVYAVLWFVWGLHYLTLKK